MIPAPYTSDHGALYPLSEAQLGIWFAHTLGKRKSLYNIGESIEILGPIDVRLFETALRQVVAETDALRLRFVETDAGPRQFFVPEVEWTIPIIDLTSVDDSREACAVWMSDAIARGVDVTRDPLFDYALLRVEPERFVWYTRYQHLCTDAFGAATLVRRVAARYSALAEHGQVAQEVHPSCLQLIEAERRYQRSSAFWRDREYWRAQLATRPERVTLGGGVPAWSDDFVRSTVDFPRAIVDRLRALGAERGTSLAQVLVSAVALYTHRLTGAIDVVLGMMTSGRRLLVNTDDFVGTTATILPLRLTIDPTAGFDKLLRQTARRTLEALRHQRYRSEFIRRDLHLRPTEPEICGPIVNVMSFDYDVHFGGHPVRTCDIGNWRGDDVEILVRDRQDGRDISIEFRGSSRLYSRDALVAHQDRYVAALRELSVASPELPIGRLNLFLTGERDRVVTQFNATRKTYAVTDYVHRLFEAQAAARPDAPALASGGAPQTYSALNCRANRLAHYLRSQGIRPGDVVAFCLDRSSEMVAAMLAIMKAGATYVPIDPAFPAERLAYMLKDSAPVLLLTHKELRQHVEHYQGKVLELDARDSRELLGRQPCGNLGSVTHDAEGHSLAYILYTSGSTGKPKGVEIRHRALTNFLCSMRDVPGCGPDDRLLAVTTPSFDIAGLEIYLPLISGGSIELATRAEVNDFSRLIMRIQTCSPTIMQATPATWYMLIEAGWEGSPGLTVLCGGEPLSRDLADRLLERCTTLWNMYGPTETTIWSTCDPVVRGSDPITIGRPIANTQVYILDRLQQPVPIGAVGEICIGGEGVARGYWNQPALTEERFVRDTLTGASEGRMYRTGDMGRFLEDGRIVHLGRSDDQVKVRGFRIELGEVESALARHPAIAQAAVAAKQGSGGFNQLIGYVVAGKDEVVSAEDLRLHLARSLPPYMVPSRFIFLSALPLTANNKVDRRALPAPAAEQTTAIGTVAEPRNHVERQLTALWRQVLGDERVGIQDNFFDRGGHSLNAVELVSQIERTYGVKLPLALLLQTPTIEQLAKVLTASGWEPSWRSLVTIQASGSAIPFFAIPGVGGNVLVFAKLAKLLGPDQPFYGLQARGLDGEQKPFESVSEAAIDYIGEIRSVCPSGPYFIGGTCTGGVFAYEVAQQLSAAGEQVALVIMETWHPSTFRRARTGLMPWQVRFIALKLAGYVQHLSDLPLRDWKRFVRSKVGNAASAILGQMTAGDIVDATAFQSERVVQATLRAIAAYDARPYPGRLLNVLAANRPVPKGTLDTRCAWESLAGGVVRHESIPARDSGQLFVSPHVERLAELLAQYATEALDRTPSAEPSGVSVH